MTEFFLIRHAENDWVSTGQLAGWAPGVHLNPHGRLQAKALSERLGAACLSAIYSSPLERAIETARRLQPLPRLGCPTAGRCWRGTLRPVAGKSLSKLQREPLWGAVQGFPSRVTFPRGETFRQAQARAVDAIERLAVRHPRQRVAIVSHSDVIKLILAHFLGLHLDLFQRIRDCAAASLSVIHLAADRPAIRCVNDTSHLPPRPPQPSPVGFLRRVGGWVRLRR